MVKKPEKPSVPGRQLCSSELGQAGAEMGMDLVLPSLPCGLGGKPRRLSPHAIASAPVGTAPVLPRFAPQTIPVNPF